MEAYMQFRVKKRINRDLSNSELSTNFICLDCREDLRNELEEESGIEID